MFDDIVRRRVALGKTFNEVIASFGHPDRKWDSLGRWEYRAGEGTAGLGFGFYTLLLKFRNGVVDSVFTAEYID